MTYKTQSELFAAASEWCKICEDAGVVAKTKYEGAIWAISYLNMNDHPEHYEFPLCLLEGKEVWVGSEYYVNGNKFAAVSFNGISLRGKNNTVLVYDNTLRECSWNPPAPKTAMVEMLVKDIEYYAGESNIGMIGIPREMLDRRTAACKKALESLK